MDSRNDPFGRPFGGHRDPSEGSWGGWVGSKMKINKKILTGQSRRFRWYPMLQVGAQIWDFQKFRVVSPKISGIQGFWGPFGLHSEAGGVVNESKRCSNDLKWSHMPSNGSKKPPLAFFKKSPKFSGNFIPKNSGMKQIAAPLSLESFSASKKYTYSKQLWYWIR